MAHVDEIRGSIFANFASSHRVLRNIPYAHDCFHDLQRPQQSTHPVRLLSLFDIALFVSSESEYQDGFPTHALRFGTIGEQAKLSSCSPQLGVQVNRDRLSFGSSTTTGAANGRCAIEHRMESTVVAMTRFWFL